MSTELKTLIEEFRFWKNEVNQGQVPKHLKQQVIELCQQYSPKQLATSLGLKKDTIKQWQRRAHLAKKSTLTHSVDFVTVMPFKPDQAEPGAAAPRLTFELSNEIKLHIHGQNTAELVELASHLAKRLTT